MTSKEKQHNEQMKKPNEAEKIPRLDLERKKGNQGLEKKKIKNKQSNAGSLQMKFL